MDIIFINTNRDFYNRNEAANNSMTIKEFIDELSLYPEDTKVVFRNDGGYTYGYTDVDMFRFVSL